MMNKHNDNENLIILSIESSCDETAAAVLKGGRKVLSNIISSQINIHREYGGVVPEIASRHHLENINFVVDEALEKANVEFKDIDLIGVANGPGLVGALLIGLATAKAYSYALGVPLVGVNHIEGHISANYIEYEDLEPPFVGLVTSGGHTFIVEVSDYGKYKVLGQTRDDAIGEAFDKVARILGLPYPGGPEIDRVAKLGNPNAVKFPRVYLKDKSLDFSFSGIKTAALNYINSQKQKNIEIVVEDVAASFQQAVLEVIVENTFKALKQTKMDKLVLAGGVAANSLLREMLKKKCEEEKIGFYCPSLILCTDNAAMIGSAAYYDYKHGKRDDLTLDAKPNLRLEGE